MKSYIGITDKGWYDLLSASMPLDEVNFWRPSAITQFNILKPGELFLFKLHSPLNYIVGGGFFAHYTVLPLSLAWETFEIANGARSLLEIRIRIEKYRHEIDDPSDFSIGCILLEKPFFLPRIDWIPAPYDWNHNIVQGKTYDLSVDPGLSIWRHLQTALGQPLHISGQSAPARYGEPIMTFPRLGQGSFKVLVTDAYKRRCAITLERTLPALEAAHIKPYAKNGTHEVSNGILLRKDLHALFDKGYLTVTPTLNIEVSRKIKEEFENGREYYGYHGKKINIPQEPIFRPSIVNLNWHNENLFKG
jgi:putative restriction endonuclease